MQIYDQDKFNHIVKIAGTLAKSKVVPSHFQNKPEEVFAAMVLGSELGFSPMQSMNAIVFIQGQATLKAQSLMAIVRAKCPTAIITYEIDEDKKIVKCSAKRNAEDPGYTSTWTMEKAKAMGLSGKDNYIKQPVNMLKWRATSEVLKVVFPDYIQGLNTTEEMEDLPPLKNEEQPLAITLTKEDLDNDFPIPEEEKIPGPDYRVQNGKFRSKQFKDIPLEELEEYYDDLESRKTHKSWETELMSAIREYMESL